MYQILTIPKGKLDLSSGEVHGDLEIEIFLKDFGDGEVFPRVNINDDIIFINNDPISYYDLNEDDKQTLLNYVESYTENAIESPINLRKFHSKKNIKQSMNKSFKK